MYKYVFTLKALSEYLRGAAVIAFDFETAPYERYRNDVKAALDAHKSHIVGISFSVKEGEAVYLPLTHKVGENAVDLQEIWAWLMNNVFMNKNVVKVAHNLAFESMFLYARGIVVQEPCYDTIAAAQLVTNGNKGFRKLADCGLKKLVPELYGVNLPSFDSVTGGRHFDELNPQDPETVRYACADADFALRLYHTFNGWFKSWIPHHRFIVEKVESPTAVYTGMMKYNGLAVDLELMAAKSAECGQRLEKLREALNFRIGDVDIGANASTKALKDYFFKFLGLPPQKLTEKNGDAFDDEALVLLAEYCAANRLELVEIFKLIQEYRAVGKIQSTYISGYLKHINAATGRIHADLLPLATETGRFACRTPNIQNCPRAGADEIGVRNFFAAPPGKVLLSLDFSQIELRVGAYYCRDEKMLQTYRENGDIHDATATVIYGEGVHNKEQRTIAKNVNFGTFYGLFPNGLQRTLKFKAGVEKTPFECEQIISNIKSGYPKLTDWQEATKRQAKRDRYVETSLGRRRYLPDINHYDWKKRSYSERCALNTPIQGTAADILKLAIGRILAGLPERPWLMPLLQIHDELVMEVPETKVSEAVSFIKKCMEEQPFGGFDVPIIAEAAVGRTFGKMKEYELWEQRNL